MSVSTQQIKELREQTGAGILDCRKALEEADGDISKALELLKEKGLAKAAGRAGREAKDGVIDLYSHGEGRMGVMVEVNCETDFVARTPEFRQFAHEMALQIAANSPRWISDNEVPDEVLEGEREDARRQAVSDQKPEQVIDRIVDGKIQKFLDDNCLLRQAYVRDEDKTVADIIQDLIVSTGENITIRRFERWELGQTPA
jgi:elongation factor Ts